MESLPSLRRSSRTRISSELREARRILGKDIDYLDASLPQLVEFPDSKALLEVHQDLSQFEKLKQGVENGDVPALADSSQETLALAQHLLTHIETLKHLRDEVVQAHRPWTVTMRERLRHGGNNDLLQMLEALGTELEQAVEWRKAFLERPVTTPEGIELDTALMEAVGNLSRGQETFWAERTIRQVRAEKAAGLHSRSRQSTRRP